MMLETKPLNQITLETIQVLYQEIRIVNTIRFRNQFTLSYGDYIAERDALFADMTSDDILTAIELEWGLENNGAQESTDGNQQINGILEPATWEKVND